MLFFPWPGDDGQGKEPPPTAKALWLPSTVDSKRPVYKIVPAEVQSFARSPSPDRAKNIVPSVLSVSLWLVKGSSELWCL
jgi:hypothetical protein